MTERPDTTRDPIDRLRAFDQVDVPDQWDDIVGRAAAPELAELRATAPIRRPRWLLAAAAATTLVVAAGVLIVADRDDEGGIAPATAPSTLPVSTTAPFEPIPSTDPPTTEPTPTIDTAPATTEPAAPASTVVPAPSNPLVSSCPDTELLAAPGSPSPPTAPSAFGRLGREPNLVLRLPNGPAAGTLQSGSLVRGITRIPGGIAILFQPLDTDPAWQLVAVGDDGSILWRRCGSEQTTELHSVGSDVIHVREIAAGWSAWRAFDVLSGQDAAPLTADPAAITLDATERFLLLDAPDSLQLVDLADGLVITVDRPAFDGEFTLYTLQDRNDDRDGVPVIAVQEEQSGATFAVYVDGEWRTDRDTLLAEREIQVNENSALYGPDLQLGNGIHARDALGATVWFHDTEGPLMTEGFHTGVFDGGAAGDVVLSNACRRAGETDGIPTCEQEALVALDLLTGEVLWERPAFGAVGPAGDGVALITTDGAWELVDVRTGERLDGQVWDEQTFSTFCCGEGDYVWAADAGGVAWSVNYDTIRVYYPESLTEPTVDVPISG